jgi:hypothetical protein
VRHEHDGALVGLGAVLRIHAEDSEYDWPHQFRISRNMGFSICVGRLDWAGSYLLQSDRRHGLGSKELDSYRLLSHRVEDDRSSLASDVAAYQSLVED